jgi:hypothetical protein
MSDSGIIFENLDLAQQSANKESSDLTDEQIREILEAAPLLKQMIESVEEEALRRLKAGKVIEGLKVVHGRGSSSWALDEEEMAEKLRKMGIPKASLYTTKLLSPTQVRKVKWAKRDGSQKQLSERQLKRIEEDYIKKTKGKLTVVSDSDHRDAVTFDAAPMFEKVENDQADGLPDWLK